MDGFKQQDTGRIDEDTLQAHLATHAERLRRYVTARIPRDGGGTPIAADDILQEVWIAAFRGVSSFRAAGPEALDRWLMTIANRKLLDELKCMARAKRGGHVRVFHGAQGRRTSYAGLFAGIGVSQRTPSRDASDREATLAIQIALGRLSQNRRRAVWMRYIEGRLPQEIAHEMHRSVSAVNSLLFHGLRELRERLGDPNRFFSDVPSSELGDG